MCSTQPRYALQISYKILKLVSDAAPELSNDVKQFLINLLQNSSGSVYDLTQILSPFYCLNFFCELGHIYSFIYIQEVRLGWEQC